MKSFVKFFIFFGVVALLIFWLWNSEDGHEWNSPLGALTAYAAGPYCATGFSNTNFNGTYTDLGSTLNGQPKYGNGTDYMVRVTDYGGYEVMNTTGTDPGGYMLNTYATGNVDQVTIVGQWIKTSDGTDDGSVANGACGGGGGESSSTPPSEVGWASDTATSTLDQVETNFAYGFFIFFISFALILWITKSLS